jgi:streptomycin 6-kinase
MRRRIRRAWLDEDALDVVARAMARAPQGGEIYLPIFEQLESELASLTAKEATLERARVRAARFMRENSIKK